MIGEVFQDYTLVSTTLFMEVYNHYGLEDFLIDENFRAWVAGNGNDDIWNSIAVRYPEKNATIQQAREIILLLQENNSALTDHELEKEVKRILTITDEKQRNFSFSFALHWKWFSVAAAILLVLGFGWKISKINQPESIKSYQQYISKLAVTPHEVINETETPLLVKLPDGSKVTLNPESRISYSDIFIKDRKREVYLSGEAFFEVQKDSQNPFFVYAHGLLTRVVGTSFLIKAHDTAVEVIVRTGRVAISPIRDINNADKNKIILLTRNQQASFSTKDNLISKSIVSLPVEIQKETSDPDFTFENRPISEVFSVLEKSYGIPIRFDQAMMRNCSLRVDLGNEPFFSKLDIIRETLDAQYQVKDGQIIISSKSCE